MYIFLPFEELDVDISGFLKCCDVGLLGFSKIWLLFAQTFWQHWLSLLCFAKEFITPIEM